MHGRAEEHQATELLERAVGYALCSVRPVTPALLSRPTPCHGWELRELLAHANESLTALQEGAEGGRVGLPPAPGTRTGADCGSVPRDPVAAFRARASRLLGVCAAGTGRHSGAALPAGSPTGRLVTVDGWPLAAGALVAAGALEVAVHGWDIARAAGTPRPIPPALAAALLRTARVLVPEPAARHPLFALPVAVPPHAGPSDRLVAFLGRDPAWW